MSEPKLSQLVIEALELWEAQNFEAAASKYEEVLKLAPIDDCCLADYHGGYAGVLESQGKIAEAKEHLEKAVAIQRNQDGCDSSCGVVVARYFHANYLLRHQEPEQALEIIAPSLVEGVKSEWLLCMIQAEAFSALGRQNEAFSAANRAIELAPSEDKRSEIAQYFSKEFRGFNVQVG